MKAHGMGGVKWCHRSQNMSNVSEVMNQIDIYKQTLGHLIANKIQLVCTFIVIGPAGFADEFATKYMWIVIEV